MAVVDISHGRHTDSSFISYADDPPTFPYGIHKHFFYWHGLTYNQARIRNHMPSKAWGEITDPLPNVCWSLD